MEDSKVATILEAARKRFAHYGISKTTMNEIAADIGMSKASLYYYFPDKENLFIAVVEQDFSEFHRTIEALLNKPNKASYKMKKYVSMRNELLGKLINLSKVDGVNMSQALNPVYDNLKIKLFRKEKEMVTRILEYGVKEGEFVKLPPETYADLVITLLTGIRSQGILLSAGGDVAAFQERIASQASLFVEIFLNGIKKSKSQS